MSFVDLMANDVWSEADIVRRTEAMIRSEFSLEAETILNRKVLGYSLGTYTPTPADQAEIARYDQVAKDAQAAGVQARADMALLQEVFLMEEAQRRLDQPIPEEPDEQDEAERAEAQAVIDGASDAAKALFEARKPVDVSYLSSNPTTDAGEEPA